MPTDQPRSATNDLDDVVVPSPLEVEGGAPRGPDRNSPIDPGTPPTDADGEVPPGAGVDGPDQHPKWR